MPILAFMKKQAQTNGGMGAAKSRRMALVRPDAARLRHSDPGTDAPNMPKIIFVFRAGAGDAAASVI
ncbi:hypothetical protein [Agrobacterium tumefaciens]|uniref:hypothetical protein n=1 Tax=Agrobacterium tumefaciens TaxID=358 RepID=UPI000553B8F7|nr:hypothetical protein [Agrobacterium tumefaciens]